MFPPKTLWNYIEPAKPSTWDVRRLTRTFSSLWGGFSQDAKLKTA
jgi:hypothetical protein